MASSIFEKTYRAYLSEIGQYDFTPHEAHLGVQCSGDRVIVPFFGKHYSVSPAGIFIDDGDETGQSPGFAACVVICKYLLMGRMLGDIPKDDAWASYKDFKDAAPLLDYFRHDVENAISACFSGRMPYLESAVLKLGGQHIDSDLSFDLKLRLDALPRLPVFLLFNDADAEFPAETRVLFERRTESYLDMESLAIVGALAADYLKNATTMDEPR